MRYVKEEPIMMDLDSDDDDMNDVLWGQVNDCMMDTEQAGYFNRVRMIIVSISKPGEEIKVKRKDEEYKIYSSKG